MTNLIKFLSVFLLLATISTAYAYNSKSNSSGDFVIDDHKFSINKHSQKAEIKLDQKNKSKISIRRYKNGSHLNLKSEFGNFSIKLK